MSFCKSCLGILPSLDHIAQSNYFRDPMQMLAYRKHSKFLADLNNEKDQGFNSTYRDNFARLHSLALVRAKRETVVYPSDSEWFGAYDEVDGFARIRSFRETAWYKNDLFGLKTLDIAGKITFYATEGDHLQIDDATIINLLHKHFTDGMNTTEGRLPHIESRIPISSG